MTLYQRMLALAQLVGGDISQVFKNQGQLSDLQTKARSNLVEAINEAINVTEINDETKPNESTTYSSAKIVRVLDEAVTAAKNDIMGGITSEDLDTIKELAEFIKNDADGLAALVKSLSNERQERIEADKALASSLERHVKTTSDNFGSVNSSLEQLNGRTSSLEKGLAETNRSVETVSEQARAAQNTADKALAEAVAARDYTDGSIKAEAAARVAGDSEQASRLASLDKEMSNRVENAKNEVMETIGGDVDLVEVYRKARQPFGDLGTL